MTFGYARCSTSEDRQYIDRQERELKAAGAEKIFSEYEHGTSAVKAQLDLLLEVAKEGDTLIVTEATRLSRSTRQFCDLIGIIQNKKLRLIIINSMSVDCRSGEIDPMTNAYLLISAVFAQLEREMTVTRIKSGLENAKAKGKKLGRPYLTKEKLPPKFFRYYPAYKAQNMSATDFARVCEVSRTTLYKYLRVVEEN